MAAIDEVKAPIVNITGGEPLLYPEIDRLVDGALKRKRHVFLSTNGLLFKEFMGRVHPHPRLNLVVHLDGLADTHDRLCGRSGVFHTAVEGIKQAKAKGFSVLTNTTIYKETTPEELEVLFAYLAYLKLDGLLLTPAFAFPEAKRDIFLTQEEVRQTFRRIHQLSRSFRLLGTPVYWRFLKGERELPCTPWGHVTRDPHGWKSPCVFLTDQHYQTFHEFMEETPWERYGPGKDPRCRHCLFHGGFEATVVLSGVSSAKDVLEMARWYCS